MMNFELMIMLELSYWLKRVINLKVLNLSKDIVKTNKIFENHSD